MADVKWIKLATNIFDNRKIKQIETLPESDAIIVMWIKLLCLAGSINDNGCIYFTKEIPYTEQMLSTQFNMPLTTVQLAIQTFEQFGMVEVIDNIMMISNWEKYQNVEGLEKIREQTRIRVANHRSKQKQLECNVTSNVTVTECNATDIDKNRLEEDKKEEKNNSKTKRFKKPSVEEIETYCNERNNNINPNAFYDYYESKDWMIGKNRMKDWKAAIRTWERNTGGKNEKKGINITKFDV